MPKRFQRAAVACRPCSAGGGLLPSTAIQSCALGEARAGVCARGKVHACTNAPTTASIPRERPGACGAHWLHDLLLLGRSYQLHKCPRLRPVSALPAVRRLGAPPPLTCCPEDAVHDPMAHRNDVLVHGTVLCATITMTTALLLRGKAQRAPGASAAGRISTHSVASRSTQAGRGRQRRCW
jgi:hypothetical protein